MDRSVFQRLDALEGEHWWFGGRRDVLGRLLAPLVRSADAGDGQGHRPRILEAGCGTGGNLAMLSSLGEVEAFEHDEQALAVARRKADLPERALAQGTLPDRLPEGGDYDMVVAFDVIEHVERDDESLAALRTRLKPGGTFVMTVPAWPFLWSRHDETHHHFRRYTRPQLEAKLKAAGYEVDYASYYNSLLFPAVVAVRAVKKCLGLKDSADDAMPPSGMNRLLRAVFGFERHWIGRVPVPLGVSLVAVARNP